MALFPVPDGKDGKSQMLENRDSLIGVPLALRVRQAMLSSEGQTKTPISLSMSLSSFLFLFLYLSLSLSLSFLPLCMQQAITYQQGKPRHNKSRSASAQFREHKMSPTYEMT